MNINIDERIYFFKEAIKSMERGVTPFCLERVSRQNKIKENYEQLLEWLEELKKLRKERNNNGWIPCSERLPEEEKDYLCCYEYTEIGGTHEGEKFKDYGVFYHDGYKWIKYWETINKKNIQVVAWQPLPEPYREEQEDEQ